MAQMNIVASGNEMAFGTKEFIEEEMPEYDIIYVEIMSQELFDLFILGSQMPEYKESVHNMLYSLLISKWQRIN